MKNLDGLSILVVDDEVGLREILREELEEAGAKVIEASNGMAALELFRNTKIDVVVSDMRMPNGNGVELLKSLQSEFPNQAPIIFIVTGDPNTNPEEVIALGAKEVIGRPYGNLLISRILKYLKGITPPPPPTR